MKAESAHPDLVRARHLAEELEDYDGALQLVLKYLRDEDPNDAKALVLLSFLYDKASSQSAEYRVLAYNIAKRSTQEGPQYAASWLNLAKIAGDLYLMGEAKRAYEQAARVAKADGERRMALVNYAAALCTHGEFIAAEEVCHKALKLGDSRAAKGTLGICLLAQGKWREGWSMYNQIIGAQHLRRLNQYAGEPAWKGEKDKFVVVYGEQGLGDEISFASMIPDLIRDSKKVVIDCDAPLRNLFARSFPQAKVYGTRWEKNLTWDPEDQKPEASIAMGALGEFYRPTEDSCPGTPYLVADPERVAMWKALWASKGKPVIGIAWSGGVQWTGAKFRRWKLRDLLPWFEAVDAHWVCLQYKDASKEIEEFKKEFPHVDIKQYPYATLTKDYDDTAALVASLDRVVSMQTAVIHLAGALGVPTWVFVYKHSQWRYGIKLDKMPWYPCVRIWRQRSEGNWPIKESALQIKEFVHGVRQVDHAA
jgi:hypothetical protein